MQTKTHPIAGIRRAGVPLALFETCDPSQTIDGCLAALNGKRGDLFIMQWDCVRGLVGVNERGDSLARDLSPNGAIDTANPVQALEAMAKVTAKAIIFAHNAHRFLGDPVFVQGLWNLRGPFKSAGCTWVGLCSGATLPDELKQDCLIVTEPLPDAKQIEDIVRSIAQAAELPPIEDVEGIADTLLGLSGFAAEQALALSVIPRQGIDRDGLWERKRRMIEQTPGLSVWRGGETFADIGGCDNVKGFLSRILKGNAKPRAIGFIDEIEKGLAGSQGDTSGVSQDQLQCFLTFMQDKSIPGMIFIGPPGAAKSAIAKAAGNEAGIPTVALDLGAMKGSLVGESERKMRAGLQVFDAVSQGCGLFIATCNSIGVLPPELRRRFTLGTFFFDLPSDAERAKIWSIYQKKFSLSLTTSGEPGPSEGWTGAEIKAACDVAWRTGLSIAEAQRFIVPVCKSAADKIQALRTQASGRFISASKPGFYQAEAPQAAAPTVGRKFGE